MYNIHFTILIFYYNYIRETAKSLFSIKIAKTDFEIKKISQKIFGPKEQLKNVFAASLNRHLT